MPAFEMKIEVNVLVHAPTEEVAGELVLGLLAQLCEEHRDRLDLRVFDYGMPEVQVGP